jgi:hypothetical protein
VQEVTSDQPGVWVFSVHSDERLDYERGERDKGMQKVQEELAALAALQESCRRKAPAVVMAGSTSSHKEPRLEKRQPSAQAMRSSYYNGTLPAWSVPCHM